MTRPQPPQPQPDRGSDVDLDFVIPVLHHATDIAFYDALAGELERRGAHVGLVTLSRAGTATLARSHPHVFYLYEGFQRRAGADARDVAEIEERYRLGNMRHHVYPERRYYGGTEAMMIARAVHTFRFFERLLARHWVGTFVNNVGGEIVRRTTARISEAGGPCNLIVDFAPFHGRIAVTTDEVTWDALPRRAPELTDEARAEVERLIAEATERRRMFSTRSRLGINVGSLYRPLRNALINRFREHGQVDYDPSYVYGERLKHLVRRGVSRVFYEQPVPGEPYVFFALHDPKDSAITVRAPQFHQQDDIIEFLVTRAVPTGHTLYVKPHPAAIDSYPIGMLARLRRMPHVRVLEPTLNSHGLIEGARAMVVINSTVGFESLFYFKPVVVLGRVFYRGRGVTYDVENLADLPATLHRAVTTEIDRDAIVRFLGACLAATYPGRFGLAEPENVRRVADALFDKARKLGLGLPDVV